MGLPKMIPLLICSLISIWFAIFGVYTFTSQYTCWLVKWNKSFKSSCEKFMWIPSAVVVFIILAMAMYKANFSYSSYSD